MTYDLVRVSAQKDWNDYHSLRRKVLWEARGREGYDPNQSDEYAPWAHPLLFKVDGTSIGTTRLDDFGNSTGAVRLVAVAPEFQRKGIGRTLSEAVERYAKNLGLIALLVNAAPDAVGFYKKTGWHQHQWDPTELAGIARDCVQMKKMLPNDLTSSPPLLSSPLPS